MKQKTLFDWYGDTIFVLIVPFMEVFSILLKDH
jgi:hypothetical protein